MRSNFFFHTPPMHTHAHFAGWSVPRWQTDTDMRRQTWSKPFWTGMLLLAVCVQMLCQPICFLFSSLANSCLGMTAFSNAILCAVHNHGTKGCRRRYSGAVCEVVCLRLRPFYRSAPRLISYVSTTCCTHASLFDGIIQSVWSSCCSRSQGRLAWSDCPGE